MLVLALLLRRRWGCCRLLLRLLLLLLLQRWRQGALHSDLQGLREQLLSNALLLPLRRGSGGLSCRCCCSRGGKGGGDGGGSGQGRVAGGQAAATALPSHAEQPRHMAHVLTTGYLRLLGTCFILQGSGQANGLFMIDSAPAQPESLEVIQSYLYQRRHDRLLQEFGLLFVGVHVLRTVAGILIRHVMIHREETV